MAITLRSLIFDFWASEKTPSRSPNQRRRTLRVESLESRAMLATGPVYRVTGDHHEQIRFDNPGDNAVIDLTGGRFWGLEDTKYPDSAPAPAVWPSQSQLSGVAGSVNKELRPTSVRGTSKNVTIQGGVVQGMMNHLAPWHVWKKLSDGSGVYMEGASTLTVKGMRIDNVEDGFEPRPSSYFDIRDVYVSRVHDDGVENDMILSGSISNSFFQTQTFYSARGSVTNPNAVVTIDNCVVELILQPHQGDKSPTDINKSGGYPFPDGLGNGEMFKLYNANPLNSGKVNIKNTVFLINRPATSWTGDMLFAPGTYQNVTVVWLGKGAYPFPAPPGVTITTNRAVFDQAKAAFFAAHPQFKEGTLQNTAPAAALAGSQPALARATDQAIASLTTCSAQPGAVSMPSVSIAEPKRSANAPLIASSSAYWQTMAVAATTAMPSRTLASTARLAHAKVFEPLSSKVLGG